MSELTAARVAAPQTASVAALESQIRAQTRRAVLRSLGTSLLTFVITVAAVLLIWVGVLWAFNISPMIAKGPVDVWNYLFTVPNAAKNRGELFGALGITLSDAAIGFISGLVVALIGASLFQLSKGIEAALLPVAMLLRSVPLIAMAPVIILIAGRDWGSVVVIGGIVVLFPALVSIAFGLKSASPQMTDVVTVYGGNAWTALHKVALPASLPSFFAAVRISVPGAITGALLAEWLATGKGIGNLVNTYLPLTNFGGVWSCVVVVTALSLLLYNVIQIVENTVLARMGMHPDRQL